MCVIAIKKVGVSLPSESNIKAMWNSNKDGAGFMYTLNDKVYIEKGFMKLVDLERALKDLATKVDIKDIPLVMHFRITTHGGTHPSNTHPFPISTEEEHLKALDLTCSLGVVHNGIISSVDTPKDSTMSDTMIYISDILSPLYMLNKNFYSNSFGKTLMENQIGWSKLAFLDKNGNIEMVGDFKHGTTDDTKDILYSNLNHEMSSRFSSSVFTTTSPDYKKINDYNVDDYEYTQHYPIFDDSEFIKFIPVGYHIGVFGGKDSKDRTIEVSLGDNFYTDEGGYIYYYDDKTKKYYEAQNFIGVFRPDALGNLTAIEYDDIDTKPFQATIEEL